MHTTPTPTVTNTAPNADLVAQFREAQAESRLVMLRVETKALKTLEALMDDPDPTGDAKKDAIVARERNRKRLAATQALTHIRAAQRKQHSSTKTRPKAPKPKDESTQSPSVPLAACRPVQNREVPLAACRPVQSRETSSTPPEPTPLPPGFTTLNLQEDWLRERKQAMSRARAKQKSRKGRKR